MASFNIKELCEILKCCRPTIMKALHGNRTAFRPFMRKKGKAIHVTKTGLKLLAEILGKDISAYQIVELSELVAVEEQYAEALPLEPVSDNPLINALIVEMKALREEVKTLRAIIEKERHSRRKLSREIKMKERNKDKAMKDLFPWMATV